MLHNPKKIGQLTSGVQISVTIDERTTRSVSTYDAKTNSSKFFPLQVAFL